jgi:hypothetical protein
MSEETKNASASRRDARKAAREKAAVLADQQDAELSDKIVEQRKAKPKAEKPKKPQKEQIAEDRAKAAQQADEQERAVTSKPPKVDDYLLPTDEEGNPSPVQRVRGKIPLAVLNEISRRQGLIIKSDAREIANAAGRAAYDVARGKREARKGPSKFQRMMDAQSKKADAKKPEGKDGK